MAISDCQPRPQAKVPATRSEAVASEPSDALRPEAHGPGGGGSSNEELARLVARYRSAPALGRFRGEVSYYSDGLAGHRTASGERYDPGALTAAHPSLPFASVVRVVREDTHQEVYVRINDRGPFVRGRVLDVSRAAARALGLLGRGVARVRAEVVELGPKRPKPVRAKRQKPKQAR